MRWDVLTWEFSKLTGKCVAIELRVEYAQLRYKPLEKIKDKQLKRSGGNFETTIYLSTICRRHLQNICKLILHGKPDKNFLQLVQMLVGVRMIKLSTLGQEGIGQLRRVRNISIFWN